MIKTFEKFANKPIKFRRVGEPKKEQLFLEILFEGGDADTKHPKKYEFKGFKYSDWEQHLPEINKVIGEYQTLQKILDVNCKEHCEEYDEVKTKYGEDMADLYDQSPRDPQCDYQYHCYIDRMELVGFDENGVEWRAYV
jgi:hypothetical protein